jgi:hypothetical protein
VDEMKDERKGYSLIFDVGDVFSIFGLPFGWIWKESIFVMHNYFMSLYVLTIFVD